MPAIQYMAMVVCFVFVPRSLKVEATRCYECGPLSGLGVAAPSCDNPRYCDGGRACTKTIQYTPDGYHQTSKACSFGTVGDDGCRVASALPQPPLFGAGALAQVNAQQSTTICTCSNHDYCNGSSRLQKGLLYFLLQVITASLLLLFYNFATW